MRILSGIPVAVPAKPTPPPPVYSTTDLKQDAPEGVYKVKGTTSSNRAVVIGNGSGRVVIFANVTGSFPYIEGLYSNSDWVATDEQVVFAIVPGEKK